MSGNEDKPIVLEMADNMKKISEGVDQLLTLGLTEDMVIILVQQKTKVPRKDIRKVFDGIKSLRDDLSENRERLQS